MSRHSLFVGFFVVLSIAIAGVYATPAAADSLSIAPTEYKASLATGESKKGFVDVVNPAATATEIKLHVQAFRQVDDQGSLQFYDDATIAKGVKLDLTDVTLGPHEGVRVYFLLDGTQLPAGDVFAAIFASTVSASNTVESVPSAQVGTLLLLENGPAPAHHAIISNLSANWLQIGTAISMKMNVTNTDLADGAALGFIPRITFEFKPYSQQTVDGPLLFARRTRVVDYSQKGSYFGPVLLRATVDGQTQTKLIFAMTGYWQWLAPMIIVLLIAGIITLRAYLKARKSKHRSHTTKKRKHHNADENHS
ncbi:MAG TPA: hypothetical protein VN081_01040 [Dongiaceae bacterium]|nr:hypothetical protein [Dongiaceae bacterium]